MPSRFCSRAGFESCTSCQIFSTNAWQRDVQVLPRRRIGISKNGITGSNSVPITLIVVTMIVFSYLASSSSSRRTNWQPVSSCWYWSHNEPWGFYVSFRDMNGCVIREINCQIEFSKVDLLKPNMSKVS